VAETRDPLDAAARAAGGALDTVANALQGPGLMAYGEASGLESGQTRA
jgi:hypothetical protein